MEPTPLLPEKVQIHTRDHEGAPLTASTLHPPQSKAPSVPRLSNPRPSMGLRGDNSPCWASPSWALPVPSGLSETALGGKSLDCLPLTDAALRLWKVHGFPPELRRVTGGEAGFQRRSVRGQNPGACPLCGVVTISTHLSLPRDDPRVRRVRSRSCGHVGAFPSLPRRNHSMPLAVSP